jgi:hypothetical protein
MIKITDKIKELLKDYEIEIISENPLSFKDSDNHIHTGLPAEVVISRIIRQNEDENEETLGDLDITTINVYKNYLLTFKGNYADEFYMSDFTTMKGDDVLDIIEQVKSYEDEISICFGTNEDLTFEDGNELLGKISIKEITDEESAVLDRLFGGAFGDANVFNYLSDITSEIDEDDDVDGVSYEQRFKELNQKNFTKVKDKLLKYGWSMLAIDDEDYLFKYSNSIGEVGFGDIELGKDLINKLIYIF